MKAVIDEDLHRSLKKILKTIGFDVFDVRDHGLRGHSDQEIFIFAQQNQAVLFSADLGFANILTFPLGTHNGIVILRFRNEMSTSEINNQVEALLQKVEKDTYKGNLIILSKDKIRIRRMH